MIEISVVIPVFNEEEVLPVLYKKLNSLIPRLINELNHYKPQKDDKEVEIIFIDDGSKDSSLAIIKSFVATNNLYRVISLSRNFGHQAAITAGIFHSRGKAVVIMDCDLQDPPELIINMIEKWYEGFDIVYGVRKKRKARFLKNLAYKLYYRMNYFISDFKIQIDSGDFSLLSRKVVDIINSLPEKERYIRGLRAWVGFKQCSLEYEREDRKFGKSKYSLLSLTRLAFRGIISTSTKPLFISGFLSFIAILGVLGLFIFIIISKVTIPQDLMPKGWTSLMLTIVVLNGFQLFSIWLLSIYIARIHREILSRPSYIIKYDSLK